MTIVARNDWCTVRPRGTPARIADRQPRLWLHHGASGSSSVAVANSYARFHIETRGWLDVGYSFLVAEGKVLEGRGVGRQGAHTQYDNASSYGICMVGSYGNRPPSDRDLDALVWLIRHGRDRGWWPGLTGGHRDARSASTSCPGDALHRLMPDIIRQARQGPVQEDDDLTPQQDKMLREVHAALMARNYADDTRRIRLSLRALGRKLGIRVDPNGDPGEDIVA